MNLGLEDAFIFSRRLVRSNHMQRYETVRKSVEARVVKRIELVSRVVLGKTWPARLIQFALLSSFVKIPLFRRQFLKTVTGLEHPLNLIA
jgi:2-polyprenyl-6-methoxyphenol hydroxylase-like FAD-dependent oxidoreductase